MTDLPRLPVLAAYPYMSKSFVQSIARVRDRLELFVDSGAFTAWTKGMTITLDEYCSFLDGLPFKGDRYMVLDVIGDGERTLANFDRMLTMGYRPVPIVTRGDDPSILEYYYAHSDLIGLGGVTATNHSSAAWCRAMMQHVGKRQAHILGMTRLEWVKLLRPWSVDSSSWLQAARYGTICVYVGAGRMERLVPRKMEGRVDPQVAARIRRYGFDHYELSRPYANTGARSIAQRINTMSWIEYSLEQQANIGTRLFLAVAAEYWFEALVDAFDRVLSIRASEASRSLPAAVRA